MCGIAGMILAERKRNREELDTIRLAFSELVSATESRGRDATGAFVVNRSGIKYLKLGLPATRVVKTPAWWALMDEIGKDTLAVIGHTRAATKGSPRVKANNHPIEIGRILGVHNGIVLNDEEIRERCPFDAEVDSAAIFALLNSTDKPLNTTSVGECLEELDGDFAIAVVDMRRPDSVFIARDGSRPLFHAHDASKGILWLSSTTSLMRVVYKGIATSLPANSVARLTRHHGEGGRVKVERFAGAEDIGDSWWTATFRETVLEDPSILDDFE